MRIEASAPGKLVLLGEYAVLEGAPALVLAVDRRAHATLDPVDGDLWDIRSPTLGMQARLRIRDGHVAWTDDAHPELAWVATLLERFAEAGRLPACRIELDSDAFYRVPANHPPLHPVRSPIESGADSERSEAKSKGECAGVAHLPGARLKLGLGSSAALTVAVLGALHALAGRPPPTLEEGVRVHRTIQGGRGSGIDIAASLAGGLLEFRLDTGHAPRGTALEMPDDLHWCCVYSGRPASTAAMLAAIAAWRERAPAACARHMDELATISRRGIEAIAERDAARFVSSIREQADALAGLGEASGVDIMSRPHRELAGLAARCGAAYKSCGAGGGDVGITFAVDDGQLQGFKALAARAGFPVIALAVDRAGLVVAPKD